MKGIHWNKEMTTFIGICCNTPERRAYGWTDVQYVNSAPFVTIRLKAKRKMDDNKKFMSESFAWPGVGYVSESGVGSWWLLSDIESYTKSKRFSVRLKAKQK